MTKKNKINLYFSTSFSFSYFYQQQQQVQWQYYKQQETLASPVNQTEEQINPMDIDQVSSHRLGNMKKKKYQIFSYLFRKPKIRLKLMKNLRISLIHRAVTMKMIRSVQ